MESSMPSFRGEIKNFNKLEVQAEVETYNHAGVFTLSLDAWLTKTQRVSTKHVRDDIRGEVVWQLYTHGDAKPKGILIFE